MDNKKYRILYNEQRVVNVFEDYGTTFIGNGSSCKIVVDTIENAKTMLESIGVDTRRLFNGSVFPETGIDYLDSIDRIIDPINFLEE